MRTMIVCAAIVLGLGSAQGAFGKVFSSNLTMASGNAAFPAAQGGKTIMVPAGTRILIRMVDSIESSKQKAGDRFTASLETNLQVDGATVAPRGATVYGRLASAESAGRMKGSSELTLELTDILIKGTAYPLLTSTYDYLRCERPRRRQQDR